MPVFDKTPNIPPTEAQYSQGFIAELEKTEGEMVNKSVDQQGAVFDKTSCEESPSEKGDEDKTPDITKLMQDNTILNPEELPGDEEADQDEEEDEDINEKTVGEKEKRDTKMSRACLSPGKEASGYT
ncbi:acidic leucine-rich nuclear phosphoprotein 32 family member B-like [Helianthus annuus]|uniref:acidic leucine-rich nuclear phosphoprotein 32 family member B-like n=1 Tax=Helianthus annuus TaxID=4232 RepID=UPI000B904B52|nr:acidic leucine-rich nuclear phosphoprotein 32 family member B-like [Helianthus annuus]